MKKTIAVGLALLMVAGAVVLAGTSFADSHTSQITAFVNRGIKMTWDGQAFEPRETDGSRLYPIVYEGRTYLPAKFVADKAGIDVNWNANTQTVEFTSQVVTIDLTTPYRDVDSSATPSSSPGSGSSSSSGSSSAVTPSDSLARAIANLPFTKFDLDIEGDDDDDDLSAAFELYSNGTFKAEVEIEVNDRKEMELNVDRALNYLLPIFQDMKINAGMSQRDIINEVIRAFKWQHGYDEFELEVRFRNGTRIDIEIEN